MMIGGILLGMIMASIGWYAYYRWFLDRQEHDFEELMRLLRKKLMLPEDK